MRNLAKIQLFGIKFGALLDKNTQPSGANYNQNEIDPEEQKLLLEREKEFEETQNMIDEKIKNAKEEILKAKIETNSDADEVKFMWPVDMENNYISANWYYSSGKLHGAIDISGAGIFGKPIYAAEDGYVIESSQLISEKGYYFHYGNYVVIAHYNGLYTVYGHMSKKVAVAGEKVKKGQIIGYVGSTGNSTGPHLHFEVRTGEGTHLEVVDPLKYLPKNMSKTKDTNFNLQIALLNGFNKFRFMFLNKL